MKQAILIIGVFVSISSLAFAGFDANATEGGITWLEDRQGDKDGWERFYSSYTNGRAVRAFLAYEEAVSEPNGLLMAKYIPVRDRLVELQATNGSWDNDIYNTSNAIWSLIEAGQSPDSNEIQRAVNWLKDRQQSDGSWDNMWHDNSVAIIALLKAEESKDSNAVANGVGWLLATQNDDGWWGVPPNSVSGLVAHEAEPVLALCMAGLSDSIEVQDAVDYIYAKVNVNSSPYYKVIRLRACTHVGGDCSEAIQWVLAAQNDDGGWSAHKRNVEPSNSVFTSNAIIALAKAGYPGIELKEGLEWIYPHISDDGTVGGDYEVVEPTEWAISGLGINGVSSSVVSDAVTALANCQSDEGSWRWNIIEYGSVGDSTTLAGLFLWTFSNSGLNKASYQDTIDNAVAFIYGSYNGDGGWGGGPASPSEMDPTLYVLIGLLSNGNTVHVYYLRDHRTELDSTWRNSLATIVLHNADQSLHLDPPYTMDLEAEKALTVSWLRDNQNPDGGWGFLPGETSVVDDTSMALIALSTVGDPNDPNLSKGAAWLKEQVNNDGGWSNAPGSPASNTQSTALAIWALYMVPPPGPNDPTVNITTDKEEYCPGETVEIEVKLSEPVCDIVGYVTDCEGEVALLSFDLQDPCNYIAYYSILTSSPPGTSTINVEATTCDSRTGFGVKNFDVLICPGPVLLMREPWVMDDDVHTGSGIEELCLLWSEPVLFSDEDITITNEDGNSVPFISSEWYSSPMVMAISFKYDELSEALKNDKYTITIADSVVSSTTGYAIDGDNNGTAGGDAVLIMEHRERHDSDNDNDIDLYDLANFANKWLWME